MFLINSVRASNSDNVCRGCLKMGDEVRIMTPEENKSFKHLIKVPDTDISMNICVFCAHILRKFSKFILQCHEANNIISSCPSEDSKSGGTFKQLHLTHNLSTTQPQVLDNYDILVEYPSPEFDDDTVFDDDLPLVLLKKEDLVEEDIVTEKKKCKKRSKKREEKNNTAIKTEKNITSDKNLDQKTKIKCNVTLKKKPKKELREGFSSRMVQETEEYVVIKLTKDQVLQEMEERSNTEEYKRSSFKCEKCVKGFNFEDVLKTHMERHSMENGSLQCEICTQYCPSVVSLRGHMKSHTTRYKCKVCGCTRQSRQHLLEHHATRHTRGALRYSCRDCDFATTKRTSMQRHVKSHRPVEKHTCHLCGKLFKSLETLRVHTMRHDKSRRVQCASCARAFLYPSLLRAHERAVHVRRDYYCVECDKHFKSQENLRLHFKKAKKHKDNDSIYTYECPQCLKRFATASTLATHVRISHGEEALISRHPCVACNKLFKSRNALGTHVRTKHADITDKVEITSQEEMAPLTLLES